MHYLCTLIFAPLIEYMYQLWGHINIMASGPFVTVSMLCCICIIYYKAYCGNKLLSYSVLFRLCDEHMFISYNLTRIVWTTSLTLTCYNCSHIFLVCFVFVALVRCSSWSWPSITTCASETHYCCYDLDLPQPSGTRASWQMETVLKVYSLAIDAWFNDNVFWSLRDHWMWYADMDMLRIRTMLHILLVQIVIAMNLRAT